MENEVVPQIVPQIGLNTTNFAFYLKSEFTRRKSLNRRYSLRAFAKFIGIEHSFLSKILRGERLIPIAYVEKCGTRLGLDLNIIENFRSGLQTSREFRSQIYNKAQVRNYKVIDLDRFEIICDWHHYAILEMMQLKNFKPEAKWISEKLKISLNEVIGYIDRLVRVGLLEIRQDGQWRDLSEGFSTHILGANYTSLAHQKMQKEILNGALEALKEVPLESRDQSSMMLTTSKKKLAEAKKIISEFRRELTEFLSNTDDNDTVYQLSISLYPLVQTGE